MCAKHDEPKKIEKVNEPKQVESPNDVRHEFCGRFFIYNEVGCMKREYTSKSFKAISNFYSYNCHGYGHNVVDYKKPKFYNDNANSRIFRDTNPIGSRRKRSHNNDSGESIDIKWLY